METQYISLNMTPSGVNPIFHISQYDVGRLLGFYVYNGPEVVDIDDYTCTVEATRTDGTQITTNVITNNNSGIFAVTATMSNVADKYNCQLVIVDGKSARIASIPFVMDVVTAALNGNAESISEDRTLYQQYNAAMQAALANEANNRINADNLEKAIRQSADNTLQNNIDAEATARQAADNTLQDNINSEASARASADSNLQSQINQIVAPSGEAPSAAEVQNARIGADGVTYDTLGTAIRSQVNNLNSYILGDLNNNLLLNYKSYIDGKYINVDGKIQYNTDYCYTGGKIPVKSNSTYQLTHNYMTFVAFYKLDGSFISGKIFGDQPQTEKFLTPKECYYIAISIHKNDKNKATFIYISPVEAIRTQVNNLNSYILGDLNNNLLLNYKSYIDGKYINVDGKIQDNTDYCYIDGKIPVKSNSTYQLTHNHLTFVAFYKLDGSFISGKALGNNLIEKFLTPKECYYIAISIHKDDKNKAKLIYISPVEEKNSNILIVDKYGNGDFTTINGALNKAYSIESKENPITILIYPGVYEEVLFIQGKHYISLIGTNRNDCIIKDETALYNNAPLRIQGQCYVANLSFISTANKYTSSTGTGKEAWATDVLNDVKNPEWLGTIGSYAVHCDDETNGENTTSRFENCYMYSETFPAFGAGMQLNNTIELVNCYLLTNIDKRIYDNKKENGQGTLLVHGKFPNTQIDEPNQKLFVKDCYIEGINSKCVNMYPSGNAPKASITYVNNTFMNNHTTNIDDLISFSFDTKYIEKCSNGNNLEFFNRKLLDS